MKTQLIIALDFPTADMALNFAKQLSPAQCKLKIGFELFVAAGPDLVRQLVDAGFDVFLDLKFHDIPNTVAAACQAAAHLGVWMLNVHAAGGEPMLQAARASLSDFEQPPKLLAVTVLTSMDAKQLKQIGVATEHPMQQVLHLAQLSQAAGLDGVVCSAQEAAYLKQQLGHDFMLVTPGIRPTGSAQSDQARIMTPEKAALAGIDYIVVGRPITQASNPLAMLDTINHALN